MASPPRRYWRDDRRRELRRRRRARQGVQIAATGIRCVHDLRVSLCEEAGVGMEVGAVDCEWSWRWCRGGETIDGDGGTNATWRVVGMKVSLVEVESGSAEGNTFVAASGNHTCVNKYLAIFACSISNRQPRPPCIALSNNALPCYFVTTQANTSRNSRWRRRLSTMPGTTQRQVRKCFT